MGSVPECLAVCIDVRSMASLFEPFRRTELRATLLTVSKGVTQNSCSEKNFDPVYIDYNVILII